MENLEQIADNSKEGKRGCLDRLYDLGKYALMGAAMLGAVAYSLPVRAEEPGEKVDDSFSMMEVIRGPKGKKIYRIRKAFTIEGRIQKPNAFYVLERSQLNYDWVTLKKSFLGRIPDSVKKHPF